jgi:hypothetical protein
LWWTFITRHLKMPVNQERDHSENVALSTNINEHFYFTTLEVWYSHFNMVAQVKLIKAKQYQSYQCYFILLTFQPWPWKTLKHANKT